MTKAVITRFAPSPTGYLHIGGARTALFNYYFAQKMGGTFRLRIEDTDRARSTDDAMRAILDGMNWLGVHHDGDVVYQSQNAADHVAAAETLLANGQAYRCYATAEEVDALKAEARENNRAFRSPYRDSTDEKDLPFAVRFRVPDGQTTIHDHVQGDVTWENTSFDDLVLLRADGTPTYMLAVVVDDHNMGITHVIRGDDHLINAGRQTQLYQALGWDVPDFAHVPLIHGPDGKKLSKRHGALGVEAYEDLGYLPSGLRNYLMKLGWSKGDEEIFLTDTALAEAFSLDGINSSPVSDEVTERIRKAIPSLKPRAKTLIELAEQSHYLMDIRPISIMGKTAKPLKREGTIDLLQALTQTLKSRKDAPWKAEDLQSLLTDFAAQRDLGFGRIGQPVRAALTGGSPSPDLSLVLSLLGREETIGRLEDAITQFGKT